MGNRALRYSLCLSLSHTLPNYGSQRGIYLSIFVSFGSAAWGCISPTRGVGEGKSRRQTLCELPRARRILGLAGLVVCHVRPGAVLAFVVISRREIPGRFTEHAWNRLIQWATYLVKTSDVHLAMREATAGTGAACFSESPALNGPIPGSSYAGACIQFSAGDPALPDTAMSGAIWARCLVPPSSETAPPRRSSSWQPWRPRRSWCTERRPGNLGMGRAALRL